MSLRTTLARIGRWPRLAAAGACLLLAAVTAVDQAGRDASAGPDTRPVLVAARPLPAGHTVTRRDLITARWPDRLAPPGTTRDRAALLGRVLAGPMAAGEPLTPRRLVDAGLTTGLGADAVAVPVDLDTDLRGLVRAGLRVDLLAVARPDGVDPTAPTTAAAAQRVAASLRVLAVTAAAEEPATGVGGCRLVVAMTREQALRIAGLRSTRVFTAVVAAP